MKKITALILALLTCFTLAIYASAEDYTIGADGNAVYSTAVGYAFKIEDVNGVVTGEDATIVTDNAALAASKSVWAVWFHAKKVSDNVYVALTDGAAMGGAMPSVSMNADEIIVIVHSASSNPNDGYPNWQDKVAALAVKTGDYLVLNDIDLATGNCANGTITVTTKEDVDNGTVSLPGNSESETENENSEPETEPESKPDNSVVIGDNEESDDEVKSSTMSIKDGWFEKWGWIVLTVIGAVLVIVLIVVLIVSSAKKKNKTVESTAAATPVAEPKEEPVAEEPVAEETKE